LPDSWNEFWERLLVDSVAVLIFAFLIQGLWFLVVDLVVQGNPQLEAPLIRASSRLGVPWVLGMMAGVGWGVWRAWKGKER
jgi:hypothetical protein